MELKVSYGENEFLIPFNLNTKNITLTLLYKRNNLMIEHNRTFPDWIFTVKDNDVLASSK